MDIRSSLDGLKTLLGVTPATTTAAQKIKAGSSADANSLTNDRATLSNAATEVAQSAADGGVRAGKVAEIQAALQAGTYDVPASAIAEKMVDAMLEKGK
jgi:flagellar biosynthesis anti-sigma factor FlgM